MSKISIEEIEHILANRKLDQNQIKEIVKDCQQVVEELKNDKSTAPKSKYEYVIILHDKEGYLDGKEIAGWVVQQAAGADAGLIPSKLLETALKQNEFAKRKKTLITDLMTMFSALKPKFLKEKELKIKTKDLTRVLVVKDDPFKKAPPTQE